MKITRNENGIWTIDRDTGTVDLTTNEVCLLTNQFLKYSLRQSIESMCHELDGDYIDLRKLPDDLTFDEFVEEVYCDLEDDVDYGDYPSEEYIKEKIKDTANYYDMEYDGDDYDDDYDDEEE